MAADDGGMVNGAAEDLDLAGGLAVSGEISEGQQLFRSRSTNYNRPNVTQRKTLEKQ